MKLFGRRSRLVVGYFDSPSSLAGLDVSDLDLEFEIKKTLVPTPNQATIKVHNLSAQHRALLEESAVLYVEFHAGYGDDLALLYRGEMRAAVTSRGTGAARADFVTTITSGDKHGTFAGRQIRVPLGEATDVAGALTLLVENMAASGQTVGKGNFADVVGKLGAKTFVLYGGALSGNTASLLTSLCRTAGLEWSIQDGTLQFLNVGKALAGEVTVLGSDSGLIDKVEVTNKGYVKATSLLIPGLRCGSLVQFDTETSLPGTFRVEKVHYLGGTREKNWYAKIECKLVA